MSEQKYPEPTVGALIFNPEGKIFLMRSYKWKNKYVIPGGHIELGENMEEALKREIKEETGLNIYDIEFLCFQEFVFDKAFWKKRHFIFFDFVCRTNSLKVNLDSEGQEYTWVSLEEALKLSTEPYTRQVIKEYIKKVRGAKLNHPSGGTKIQIRSHYLKKSNRLPKNKIVKEGG